MGSHIYFTNALPTRCARPESSSRLQKVVNWSALLITKHGKDLPILWLYRSAPIIACQTFSGIPLFETAIHVMRKELSLHYPATHSGSSCRSSGIWGGRDGLRIWSPLEMGMEFGLRSSGIISAGNGGITFRSDDLALWSLTSREIAI